MKKLRSKKVIAGVFVTAILSTAAYAQGNCAETWLCKLTNMPIHCQCNQQ